MKKTIYLFVISFFLISNLSFAGNYSNLAPQIRLTDFGEDYLPLEIWNLIDMNSPISEQEEYLTAVKNWLETEASLEWLSDAVREQRRNRNILSYLLHPKLILKWQKMYETNPDLKQRYIAREKIFRLAIEEGYVKSNYVIQNLPDSAFPPFYDWREKPNYPDWFLQARRNLFGENVDVWLKNQQWDPRTRKDDVKRVTNFQDLYLGHDPSLKDLFEKSKVTSLFYFLRYMIKNEIQVDRRLSKVKDQFTKTTPIPKEDLVHWAGKYETLINVFTFIVMHRNDVLKIYSKESMNTTESAFQKVLELVQSKGLDLFFFDLNNASQMKYFAKNFLMSGEGFNLAIFELMDLVGTSPNVQNDTKTYQAA